MIRIWGKEDCVIGKKIWDVLPEAQESFRNILDEVFNTGETYWGIEDLSDLMVNGKMHTLYFNFTSKALREADGRIYGILNMAIDVSEQVLTGRKMEESEELFRILAETLPQLVWVTDANGNQLYASGRWKQYTGIESLGEASNPGRCSALLLLNCFPSRGRYQPSNLWEAHVALCPIRSALLQ